MGRVVVFTTSRNVLTFSTKVGETRVFLAQLVSEVLSLNCLLLSSAIRDGFNWQLCYLTSFNGASWLSYFNEGDLELTADI